MAFKSMAKITFATMKTPFYHVKTPKTRLFTLGIVRFHLDFTKSAHWQVRFLKSGVETQKPTIWEAHKPQKQKLHAHKPTHMANCMATPCGSHVAGVTRSPM
jgi:hypothetical protein